MIYIFDKRIEWQVSKKSGMVQWKQSYQINFNVSNCHTQKCPYNLTLKRLGVSI